MSSTESVLERLAARDDVVVGPGASEDEIAEAEGCELVRIALSDREDWRRIRSELDAGDEFHDSWISILPDGRGGFWVLDTGEEGCPVLHWEHELLEAMFIAPGFGAWLEGILDRDEWFGEAE